MKIKGLLRRTSHDPEVQYVEHNAIFYNIQSVFSDNQSSNPYPTYSIRFRRDFDF